MSEYQQASLDTWNKKYQLKDNQGVPLELSILDNKRRVAKRLASVENNPELWEDKFLWAMENGAYPAGRIMSNAGAEDFKPKTSLINCTVSQTIEDSMVGILDGVKNAGITLAAGCGIGYDFSTLRPSGAYVAGVGASTSGAISFMNIYDSMCFTVASAGGRRGAQMGTLSIDHPDVLAFIQAKREDGRLRQFNLSVLITDEFIHAVKENLPWYLIFPVHKKEYTAVHHDYVWKNIHWDADYFVKDQDGKVAHKIYHTIPAKELWDIIMKSTYDYAEPGFLLIDEINKMNPLNSVETIRATNPCGIH